MYTNKKGALLNMIARARRKAKGARPNTAERHGAFLSFMRNDSGVTAIEFALIAPVFLYLLMGILELSLMFFATIIVDGAVLDAGRRIRTGQAQTSGDTLGYFTTEVCDHMYGVYSCSDITFDVRTFSDFASVSVPIEVDDDGEYVTEFSAGSSGEITAVRAIYAWNFFTPLIGAFFGEDGGNSRTLTMTTVFRNEAY